MAIGGIQLSFQFDPKRLGDDLMAELRDAFDEELINIADELQQASPEAASGSLKAGWDVTASARRRNLIEIQGSITNSAEAALFRIVGRGPGKLPPPQPIEDWVEVKLNISDPKQRRGVAFLIRRKIGQQGTEAYRARDNFAGLRVDGSFIPGGILDQGEQRIRARLQAIADGRKPLKRSRRGR